MKRARLIVSIITCFFAVAVLCFGVFAAVNTGFSLGGQLEYEVNNAFVDIETKVYKYKQGITDVSTGTQLVDTLKDMTLENIEANKSRLNLASSSVSVPKYSTSTGQGSSLNSISLKYDEGHGFTYIVVINIQNEVADIPAYAVVNSVNPPQNSWYVDSSGQAKIEPGEKNKNIVIAFGLNDIKEEIETGSTFSYGIACGKYEASAALQYTTHAGQSSELPNSSNGGLAPQQSGAYVDISGIDTTKLDSSVLIIPDQYGGINVTTMSAQFADISTVTSVIFGKNMISTPDMSGFKNLVSVVFDGNQVTSMANFDRCLKLTSITVPASVTSLNLNGCTSLGGVIFKDGFAMTEFATATFKNCISLTGIKIPDTITTLKSELFNGCINLTTVHIPETVTKIEEYVFTQTKFLENLQADHNGIATSVNGTKQFAISVPTTVTNLNLLNTKVIARYALHGCTSITSVHLPVDLEFIGNYAFATWTNSQTIYQPNVAEYTPVIEPYAFANCNAVMGSHSGSSIVVFDTDGGDALENMQVPLSGSEQQIELPTPVKEGYALVEWQITTNTTPACRISNNKLIIPAAVLGQIELKATYKSAMGFLRSNWLTALGLTKTDIKEIYFSTDKPTGYESMTAKSVGANNEGTDSSNSQQAYDGTVGYDVTAYYTTHSSGTGYTIYLTCPYTIYAPSYSYELFRDFTSLTTLNLANFNTSKVTSMGFMFYGCSSLTSLDVSNFDTSKVTYMGYMFYNCSNLTSLAVSGFDTSQVTDMQFMFYGCSGLTSLAVSGFDTSKVIYMGAMFQSCSNLTSLDVSSFDTSNVTYMEFMFYSCSSLTSLAVSGFDTSKVTYMGYMFYNCSNLTSLDVSNFNTSNVTGMVSMFSGCSKLTSLAVSGFDTSQVTNMQSMFNGCSGLTSLAVSGFDTSKVTNMSYMFQNCSSLTSLAVSGFDTSKVTNMFTMFRGCSSLTSLDVSNFDTSQVTSMGSMFYYCSNLTSLAVSGFDTSQVTNMGSMFYYCSNLTSLDVSEWDTSKVTKMNEMFDGCSKLTSLDVSGFVTNNVTHMDGMFSDCRSLTSLDVSNFDTSNVNSTGNTSWSGLASMFHNCSNLTSLDVSNFDTSNVTSMRMMFSGCNKLTNLDVSKWETSKVRDVYYMFSSCRNLTSLDLSGFDMTNVTDVYSMLSGTTNLVEIVAPRNVSDSYPIDLYKNFYNKATGAGPYTQITSANCSASTTNKITLTTTNTISYQLNGATMYSAPKEYTLNSPNTQTITIPTPTKEGYALESWEITTNCTPAASISGNVLTIPANATGKIILNANFLQQAGYLSSSWFTTIGLTKTDIKEIYFSTDKPTGYESMTAKSVGANNEGTASSNTQQAYDGTVCYDVTAYYTTHSSGSGYTIYITCPYTIFAPSYSYQLFYNFTALTTLDLSNFNTSKVTYMSSMFHSCSSLTSLDVSNFDTSQVTKMGFMFSGCNNLTSLAVSGFDTSQVTSMSSMFQSCRNLTSLDVSNFDTRQVTDMGSMFSICSNLTSLDVSNFNTSQVTGMFCMFQSCRNLTSLDLSGFDTSQVTVMDYMFNGCSSLTSLDLSNFDMTNVTSVSRMLYGCSGLTTLDLSSFDMTNVTNVSSMLYGTTNLVEIVAPRNVSDSYKIDLYKNFYNKATGAGPYTQITAANCSASTTNKTTLTTGFAISYNLNGGTVETANPSLYNIKTTEQTITLNEPTKEGYGLASWEFTTNTTPASTISGNVLTIPANATGKISLKANLLKSEGYLNRSWRNLLGLSDSEIKEIYIQKEKPAGYESMTAKSVGSNEYNVASYSGECFDVTAYYTTHSSGSGYTVYITCPYTIFAPKMSDNLFSDLSSLIKIEFLNFDTSKTSSMHSMFTNSKMETLDLSCFDTSNVTTMSQMFRLCDKLVTLNVESFNTSKVTSMYSMFAYCKKLENVDVSHFKTGAITESDGLVYMFNECNSLISLDLSNWHISTVTSLNSMFQNCSKLTSLDVSKWNTSNVTSMYCLFTGCKKLATIDVSKWNTSKVTTMHAMFASCESLQSINVSSFDTSNVTDMSGMFEVCYALTDITGLKKLDTSKVTDMNRMFYYCNKLTSLDVSGFDTSEVTNMSYMFNNCIYLTSINVSNFNTSKVTNMQSMFYACRNIEYINISNFDMTKVTTVSGMFSSNDSLVEIVAPRNVSDSYPINLYKNFYNKATGAGPYTQINSTNCSTEGSIVTLTRIFQISYNTSGLTTTEENTNTYINDINIQYVYLKNPIVTSGVTFNGWSFVTNSTPASTISGSTLTIPANAMGHIELKANIEFAANYQFEISLQNVFQDDGETLKSGITYSGTQTVNYTSESSIVLPTLTKDYTTRVWWEVLETSGNWTKGETFEMGQTIASGKYGNIKLVLKYEWDLYTVVFNNNGHGSTTIPSVQILYNTGLGTVLTEMPTLEDNLYTFEGWYKTSELKGSIVSLATLFNNSQGYTFDATTKTFTIYAKWTAKKFGVTFVSDGQLGGIAFADQISNLSYGATVALPTDIKLGYNFIGWATSESGGDLYTDTFTMLTGEVILYAQWSQENYTITFDANGGSVSLATQTYKYGDTLSLPTPTKSGKTFKGWYLETAVEVWDGTTMTAPTGSGTRADPYIIQSGANLAYISNQLQTNASGVTNYENKFFVQTKNINLGGHEFTPIGANYNTGFRGTYNGNGFEIHGLKIAPTATNTYYGGLFGWIGTQNVFGMVANVTIVNAIINVTTNVSNNKKINIGTLAGCVQQGYIVNCKAINTSIGYEDMNYAANKVIGGLVGTVTVKAYIDNCYTSGAIISGHQICEKGTQTNCTSDIVTGTTTATASTAGTFGVTTTARTGTYKLETTYPFVGNVTVYAKWE